MRKKISRHFIITGLILTPILLVIYGNLAGRKTRLEEREVLIQKSGQPCFVSLERAHVQKAAQTTHYYFTYQILSDEIKYRTTEEVTSEYFHSHTEGRNVEALLYIDEGNLPHTHLRGNAMPGYDSLPGIMRVSLYGWMSSAAMLLLGILMAWPDHSDRFSRSLSEGNDPQNLN